MKVLRALGAVTGVFVASGTTAAAYPFVTVPTGSLPLDQGGIRGDLHAGATRTSGAREPWLPRGRTLRNDRQLSALCPAELGVIAQRLGLDALPAEWLGGNLLVEGLAGFSHIAPGSRLAIGGQWCGQGRFDGAAVLRVEAYNAPCRRAGAAIAAATGRKDLTFAFVKAAAGLRGLVLSVDLAGTIGPGDAVVVIPPVLARGG
ncbi:MOSC domain-containing protein [Bosea sp. (in: a-proteobacteria)]|uniref:MOSC domain-containing protein n=1 Tax=Bosea sp. (in: a-proteobacteria) TaxID=1871050 RepID=UPI002732EAC0|nr:MOSC domain-containing protein [Bosea sp. (in: a-proteobacteria)]MDP3410729.1 MOSC domain-containing protein [Bosea sp. (in: a-proteobacteria)]